MTTKRLRRQAKERENVKTVTENPVVRSFLCLFFAIALTLSLFAVPARASDVSVFQFSYKPQENITFSIRSGVLTLSNLPDIDAFRSVLVNVVNKSGYKHAQENLIRTMDGSASMSLGGLEDGEYYVELFFSAGGNRFTSYVFGDVVGFRWQNGTGAFAWSPTLAHNQEVYESGRSDREALAFYLAPSDAVQSTDAAIVKIAREITKNLGNDYDKALAIHDWICANLWYDVDAASNERRPAESALATLNSRRAVCEGYANLTAALLRAVNIPAKTVIGYALDASQTEGWTEYSLSDDNANHSWNEAYIDGRWIIMDATWNSRNEFSGGSHVRNGGLYSYRYFDATIEAFSIDHRIVCYPDDMIPVAEQPSAWALSQVDGAISAGLVPENLRMRYTRAISRAEFCALAASLYEIATESIVGRRAFFSDTSDVNVQKLGALGVVGGVGNGKFEPDRSLTREEAATMLARLADAMGKPLPQKMSTFADNNGISNWAIEAVGQVQAAGIMQGMGNDTFMPKGPYTREQSIVAIMRFYDLLVG